jgi:hypothetical protein
MQTLDVRWPFEVRRLALLLRVGNLWRCGDGLFRNTSLGKRCTSYNAPPTSRNRTADRWSLRNFLPRSSLSWLEKPKNRMRRDLDCMADVLMGFHWSTFSKPNTEFDSDLVPCDFWAFPTMKRELWGRNFEVINGLQQGSGWSVVRSTSLAERGTSKKRPSPHLHKFPTQSNKVSPWTFQKALVHSCSNFRMPSLSESLIAAIKWNIK